MKLTVPALVNTVSTIKLPFRAPRTPLVRLNTVLPVKCSDDDNEVAMPVPELMMLEVISPNPWNVAPKLFVNIPLRNVPPFIIMVPEFATGALLSDPKIIWLPFSTTSVPLWLICSALPTGLMNRKTPFPPVTVLVERIVPRLTNWFVNAIVPKPWIKPGRLILSLLLVIEVFDVNEPPLINIVPLLYT